MSYLDDVVSDAQDTVSNFEDEILEMLVDKGEASDDLSNDYSDSYHHENHVDKSYTLQEAAELLDYLSEWEETDYGLWQGLEPREAVCCQAAYTYGNAVYAKFQELISDINSEAEDVISEYDDKVAEAKEADAENEDEDKPDLDDALEALKQEKEDALREVIRDVVKR